MVFLGMVVSQRGKTLVWRGVISQRGKTCRVEEGCVVRRAVVVAESEAGGLSLGEGRHGPA
jgi:hypothetical protein